jgi:chemotaxis response regulator CheB
MPKRTLKKIAEARLKTGQPQPLAKPATAVAASQPIGVVGIGASAGGLEGFTELLKHLPPSTGFAFVMIQHLDPSHDSILPELLAKATTMAVTLAKDGMRVRPNEVFVIPPGDAGEGWNAGAAERSVCDTAESRDDHRQWDPATSTARRQVRSSAHR